MRNAEQRILFAVSGQEGSYSDWSCWTVAVFTEKEKAEACAAKLNQWVKDFTKAQDESDYGYLEEGHPLAKSPDPNDGEFFSFPYSDRQYTVELLFIHENIDELRQTQDALTDFAKEKGWVP